MARMDHRHISLYGDGDSGPDGSIEGDLDGWQDPRKQVRVDPDLSRYIAFAKGGAHLPIVHALLLLSTQE